MERKILNFEVWHMKFAVMGGDARIAALCRALLADGHRVSVCALEGAEDLRIWTAPSPAQAVRGADCVVLPLPAAGTGDTLNAPLSLRPLALGEALAAVEPGTPVCAGRVSPALEALARDRGLELWDYFRREELAVLNAAVTAEGALEALMRETARTVWGSRVLIVGFGRIGKLLARRLRDLGAAVAVSSRTAADRAWCRALGYEPLETGALDGQLGQFDAVVNTVPAPVLGRERLARLKKGALCLDLASSPGGVDFAAAEALGVRALQAPGLPGRAAPDSAGEIIRDTIYNILKERETGGKRQ